MLCSVCSAQCTQFIHNQSALRLLLMILICIVCGWSRNIFIFPLFLCTHGNDDDETTTSRVYYRVGEYATSFAKKNNNRHKCKNKKNYWNTYIPKRRNKNVTKAKKNKYKKMKSKEKWRKNQNKVNKHMLRSIVMQNVWSMHFGV